MAWLLHQPITWNVTLTVYYHVGIGIGNRVPTKWLKRYAWPMFNKQSDYNPKGFVFNTCSNIWLVLLNIKELDSFSLGLLRSHRGHLIETEIANSSSARAVLTLNKSYDDHLLQVHDFWLFFSRQLRRFLFLFCIQAKVTSNRVLI